jgi:hypothetical protein
MIRLALEGDAIRGPEGLPEGSRAYVDAGWLSPGTRSAAALVVGPEEPAADRAAGLALVGVALAALEEVAELPAGRVQVIGSGLVARTLQALLPPADDGGRAPAAIVDTTGDPEALADATRRLEDLGTLVLAGEPADRPHPLDLYPDVHVRGLRIVGIPPASLDSRPAEDRVPGPALAELEREPLAAVNAGEPLPSAAWYRLA